MKKFDIQSKNPELYRRVKAEQDALNDKCSAIPQIARLCPYCGHRCSTLLQGEHSYSKEKCPYCGEEVIFKPLKFRISH